MRAYVRLRLPDGTLAHLGPGDMLGRTWSAALRLDDPQVSEAHAFVSLRGGALLLLSLRRRFLVDGRAVAEVELAPGQRLALSAESELVVEEVGLPDSVLGVEGPGLTRQVLEGTSSVLAGPPLRVVPGVVPGAAAILWSSGEDWRVRIGAEAARSVQLGDRVELGGQALVVVAVPLAGAGQEQTRAGLDAPLTIISWFDTVHLCREGSPPAVLTGQLARLLAELVAIRAPAPWEDIAHTLWPDNDDRDALRRRWDVLLVRLRDRLRAANVRPELVRSSRGGLIELVLQPADRVEDRG